MTYSCIEGGLSGTGNTNQNPRFWDVAQMDLRPCYFSPCIDAGTSSGAPLSDILERTRPYDGDGDGTAETDMGAYEEWRTSIPVVISEIVADNRTGLEYAPGQRSGWIEIQNMGGAAVDMTGWSLTTDPDQPRMWYFPTGTTIPAGGCIVVFASGLSNGSNLHTNFTLANPQPYLALFAPGATAVPATEFLRGVPEIEPDLTYSYLMSYPLAKVTGNPGGYHVNLPPTPSTAPKGNAMVVQYNHPWDSGVPLSYANGVLLSTYDYLPAAVSQPSKTFLQANLTKYSLFVYTGHASDAPPPLAGTCIGCTDDAGTQETYLARTEVQDIIAAKSHAYRYVHLTCCDLAWEGDLWRSAFNAQALLCWQDDISYDCGHMATFEERFWNVYATYQDVQTAADNANYACYDDFWYWYELDGKPWPIPKIFGDVSVKI